GEIYQNRQSMPLAAAENDEIRTAVPRHAHDLGFDIAALHPARRAAQPELGAESREALPRALEQLFFDLYRGHEGFTHRLDRHEFHDVQQLDFGAEGSVERLRLASIARLPSGKATAPQIRP